MLAAAHARSFVNDSPFVGEHSEARTVQHENGRISSKLNHVKTSFNKYESLIVRDGLFKGREQQTLGKGASSSSWWSDFLFGKPEPERKYGSQSHRLGAELTQDLVNTSGSMWTGPIYMGGNTLMDVVFDTGSDWLVVEGSDCSNCEGNKYNIADSTGNPQQVNASQSQRNYGSASLTGYEYKDTVCVKLGTCLSNFEFFLIDSQTGISEPIDGILGLSRNAPFYIAQNNENTSGPLLTEHLFDAGQITADKFSFYF